MTGVDINGFEEMLSKAQMLDPKFSLHARKAVSEGAKYFAENLTKNTPVSSIDKTGKGPLKDHVKVTGVSVKTGEFEAKVGYDKVKGRIAHFPNSGTSKQDPQHFVEETQAETKDQVINIFKDNLKFDQSI